MVADNPYDVPGSPDSTGKTNATNDHTDFVLMVGSAFQDRIARYLLTAVHLLYRRHRARLQCIIMNHPIRCW